MVLVARLVGIGKTKIIKIAIQLLIVMGLPVFLCTSNNNITDNLTIQVDTLSKFNSFTEQAITICMYFVIMEKCAIDVISNIFKNKSWVDRESFKFELKAKLLHIVLMVYKAFYATQQQPYSIVNQRYKLSKLSLAT